MLQTIVRTGAVLELFTREKPEWGVTEIAAALGVPKSNAHEIVSSLAAIDLLQRTGSARYRLGWRIMTMARDLVAADPLQRSAPDALNLVARETGETVHLTIWDGRRAVFIARVLGERGVNQDHAKPGSQIEAHCTASGKVLLAGLPWNDVARRVSRIGLHARTANSIQDMNTLYDQLANVRSMSVALNWQEADDGVAGIAVPIMDADGHVIAALGVSTPFDRMPDFRVRYEKFLRRMASSLGRTLPGKAGRPAAVWLLAGAKSA
jgi:DNA-binding IclR family transcriptional regulator